MSRIFIDGLGAVSPAGWGVPALRASLGNNVPLPVQGVGRPGWETPLFVRPVPPPPARPAFLAHPRLRRANSITQFTVAAALEALGETAGLVQRGAVRLGIVVGVMAGSVNYSRRFYEEVLKDPATASPLMFPETVFNASASHLAAMLGSNASCYTLVGDDGTFLQGIALAAQWLADDKADVCLVVGAEETDWIVADAIRAFHTRMVHGAGAGALLLGKDSRSGAIAELAAVTDSFSFTQRQTRAAAARRMRAQLPPETHKDLLCTSTQQLPRPDAAETQAWSDWTGARLAPRAVLGEAFLAATAWQCVAACDALRQKQFAGANVSVVGANQQAIGARFAEPPGGGFT
jgi:3-oxoacyl-(acyl-carrier-protein) synthase